MYSTSTGAVGISRNCGSGRSGGALASLVQEQHEVARMAEALARTARINRVIVSFVLGGSWFLKSILIQMDRKNCFEV